MWGIHIYGRSNTLHGSICSDCRVKAIFHYETDDEKHIVDDETDDDTHTADDKTDDDTHTADDKTDDEKSAKVGGWIT